MKKASLIITILVVTTLLSSCINKTSLDTATNGKSLLWQVSGNGLDQPSYFFGTMHLMCAEDAELSNTLKELIHSVDQIYLEIDLDNASELLTGLLDIRVKSGKTLSKVLSKNDYEKVSHFFNQFHLKVPFSVLETQPPLMISSTLYELMLPCDQKNGVEIKIVDEAYKEKKQTKGLETIAFQASIFDSIPYEAQANDLVKLIDNLESNRKLMNEMIDAYKSQDIERLYELSAKDAATSNYMDLLLFQRNKNWASQFNTIAKERSTLFAVGAGHLAGSKGVLNLLKEAGYIVRPLAN